MVREGHFKSDLSVGTIATYKLEARNGPLTFLAHKDVQTDYEFASCHLSKNSPEFYKTQIQPMEACYKMDKVEQMTVETFK